LLSQARRLPDSPCGILAAQRLPPHFLAASTCQILFTL